MYLVWSNERNVEKDEWRAGGKREGEREGECWWKDADDKNNLDEEEDNIKREEKCFKN